MKLTKKYNCIFCQDIGQQVNMYDYDIVEDCDMCNINNLKYEKVKRNEKEILIPIRYNFKNYTIETKLYESNLNNIALYFKIQPKEPIIVTSEFLKQCTPNNLKQRILQYIKKVLKNLNDEEKRKMRNNYNLLVVSDDYSFDIIKENCYEEQMNYHKDKPFFKLTIVEDVEVAFKLFKDYDLVVIDYGLLGEFNKKQLKMINRNSKFLVTSAFPKNHLRADGCLLPYVDFSFDLMYIDLINYVKKLEEEN